MVFHTGKRLRAITKGVGDKDRDRTAPKQQDAQALLASANNASERVAGQHIAFMAVCVYVLVIVFGTTDVDLLIGKGIKLPVVNVDVPTVGFYAFAPYLVVLVHFNLLLQLQLLSHELFSFDAAVPREEYIGGLRDRLHTFPYTYFLVGRMSPLMRRLVGLMVSITMMLLPFVTLIALQLWFLAYQSEVVTWLQRIAIWIDIVIVTMLWPIILHSKDDWKAYCRKILKVLVPRRRVWIAFGLLLLGQVLFSFSAATGESTGTFSTLAGPFVMGYALILLSPPTLIMLLGWKSFSPIRKFLYSLLFVLVISIISASLLLKQDELILAAVFAVPWLLVPLAMFWHPESPRGSLVLLLVLYTGLLLPLTLHVDGERIERLLLRIQGLTHGATVPSGFIEKRRRLNLTEQVLLAKPASAETLRFVRSGEGEKALQQTEPINSNQRKLRHANMYEAILLGAYLRQVDFQESYLAFAHLQGASLYQASLQGASLQAAHLQSAILAEANLQGAYLGDAHLQGADLQKADLRGADLRGSNLMGADLRAANLQGTNLSKADLQGADLRAANLQGADLREADLLGADLRKAKLDWTDLRRANLNGARIDASKADLVDARAITWVPLEPEAVEGMIADAKKWIQDNASYQRVVSRFKKESLRDTAIPPMRACLATSDMVECEKRYDPEKAEEFEDFKQQLHSALGLLACESPHLAWAIIQQIEKTESNSSRKGLGGILRNHLADKACKGLQELSAGKRKQLLEGTLESSD